MVRRGAALGPVASATNSSMPSSRPDGDSATRQRLPLAGSDGCSRTASMMAASSPSRSNQVAWKARNRVSRSSASEIG